MVGFRVKLARRLGRMYALAECGSLFCAAAKEKKKKTYLVDQLRASSVPYQNVQFLYHRRARKVPFFFPVQPFVPLREGQRDRGQLIGSDNALQKGASQRSVR